MKEYKSFLPGHASQRDSRTGEQLSDSRTGEQLMFQRREPTGGWGRLYTEEEFQANFRSGRSGSRRMSHSTKQAVVGLLVLAVAFIVILFLPHAQV